MQLVDRLRKIFMSAAMISREELLLRHDEAVANLATAQVDLEAEEEAGTAAGLSGPVDDVSLARSSKRIETARSRRDRWQGQLRSIEAAMHLASEREAIAAGAVKYGALCELLTEREGKAAAVRKATEALAAAFTDFSYVNARVWVAFPERPRSRPALFDRQSVQTVTELLLYGLTDRRWIPRRLGLETASTARQLPTIVERVRAENKQLEAEFKPKGAPSPEAA
ncbi:MAG: hypothetical protein WD944_06495 [Steroidobacteraceae bacterium]